MRMRHYAFPPASVLGDFLSKVGNLRRRESHAGVNEVRSVALDLHMGSTTVGLAGPGREAPVLYGDISTTPEAIAKLARKLDGPDTILRFCYEAGPCGYGAYRQLTTMGYECCVVAPSMTPRLPGERIKTDRRDALSLARLYRSGDLTPVWVPNEEQEAVRDLVHRGASDTLYCYQATRGRPV